MPAASPTDVTAVHSALSSPRMSTYMAEAGGDARRAAELYGWNARMSAALMVPAHFAEITTRNAVSDALTTLYGSNWPWSPVFQRSLPSPAGNHFNPRKHLLDVIGREKTTGKVIAELNFIFWEHMFTSRHNDRIWAPYIRTHFPNAATGSTPKAIRVRVHSDLSTIRQLRNRLAHHEPILSRDLGRDLHQMLELISLRSLGTASWVRAMEEASSLLATRP